jgi:hypothetical protein
MNKTMKSKRGFSLFTMIYGIIVTSLMVLIFGAQLIGDLIENGTGELKKIGDSLVHWDDDPTGFFFTYLLGYAIVWWKRLAGALIIMAGSLLWTIINIDNPGNLIFTLPTFAVGFFYLISWLDKRKEIKKVA